MTEVNHGREADLSTWRCRVCGQPLMAIPSGSTCSSGCVGVLPRMPSLVRRINHALIGGIQRVENRWGHYYLEDGTEVVLGKQINREVTSAEIKEVALDGNKIFQIREKV